MGGWKKIWNNNQASNCFNINTENSVKDVFTILKLYTNPNFSGTGAPYELFEQFTKQFSINIKELSFSKDLDFAPNSFFDVGCATGTYLYYLSTLDSQYKLGGVDYSESFIEVAKRYIKDPIELYCGEAIRINTDIKYDCVYSRSIFQYFDDLNYGEIVAEKMIEKANRSVGIFDVHDLSKKEDFLSYRRSVIENFDEKYRDTQHLFYPKSMFADIAERYDCDVKFAHCFIPGYWNAPFTYDVYFYKR